MANEPHDLPFDGRKIGELKQASKCDTRPKKSENEASDRESERANESRKRMNKVKSETKWQQREASLFVTHPSLFDLLVTFNRIIVKIRAE